MKRLCLIVLVFYSCPLILANYLFSIQCFKDIPLAKDADELMEKIRSYLQDDLRLRAVELERRGREYALKVKGCCLCHGDLVRERHGIAPACGISLFPVGAVAENLGIRNVRLKGIRKPGPPGDCELVHEIKV